MNVGPGEIVGLLGANGAGETTLLRLLLGLAVPTEGAVTAFGRAPDRTTRGRLGYVPQGRGLWQTLTVAENVSFAAAAFDAELPVLDPSLAAVEHRLVGEIGLGLQRRLAFTIALAHRPELPVRTYPPPASTRSPVPACGTPSTNRPSEAPASWSEKMTVIDRRPTRV